MREKFTWQGVKKIWGPLLAVLVFFILASYITQSYTGEITVYMKNRHLLGIFVYILINILAIVIAPVSVLPLVPVAVSVWGPFWAGVMSVFGWTVGAVIAFYLAQVYGQPFVKKMVSLDRLQRIEKYIPDTNIFWSVVFLRMVIPVDGLSYALGLFSRMKIKSYAAATLIGVVPFAFIFSYAGVFSVKYQIAALVLALIIFYFGWQYYVRVHARKRDDL